MNSHHVAALINILGFITGAALYAMLLVMLLRAAGATARHSSDTPHKRPVILSNERLLLITALPELLWNLGALVIYAAGPGEICSALAARLPTSTRSTGSAPCPAALRS